MSRVAASPWSPLRARAARSASRRRIPAVAEAIVQPVVAVLPELERLGREAEAAPGVGERHVTAGVVLGQLGHPPLENSRRSTTATLRRGERAQLASAGAAVRVGLGLLARRALHRALDPHLTPEQLPVEQQRRARVGGELAALAALVVREEHEPVVAGLLDQHHSHRRGSVGRGRGQRGGLGLAGACALGRLEPLGELPDRIRIDVLFAQRLRRIGQRRARVIELSAGV